MALGLVNVENGAWNKVRRNFARMNSLLTGQSLSSSSSPEFAGGTFTGVVDGTTPTADAHLATKAYVDIAVGGAGLIGVIHDCGTSDVSLDEDISFGGGYSL